METDPRERVIALLGRWRSEQPWARAEPASLGLGEVALVGPVQVSLRSVFESRGVRYALRPASHRTMRDVPGPDPWVTALEVPDRAPIGFQTSRALANAEIPLDCGVCSAQGELRCPTCGGDGSVGSGRNRRRCDRCRGRGQVRCDTCEGSGGVIGSPEVWARIDQHVELRTAGTDALPLDVAFDLVDHPAPGELLHRQEGERIEELRVPTGYRGEPALAADVSRVAETILRESGVAPGARIRAQVLELRRTPVFEARLPDGEMLHVWGEPPRVHPKDAALTWLGRIFRFLAK